MTDGRYIQQAARESPGYRWSSARPNSYPSSRRRSPARLAARRASSPLGLAAQYRHLLAESQGAFDPKAVTEVVESLRECKDEADIAIIRQAQQITDVTFAHLQGWLRPGLTEL